MLRWIKNSKSTYGVFTAIKGIKLNKAGRYVACLNIRIAEGINNPKKMKNIYIGSYDTLKEAKQKRVEYILSLL
jgi:hypothetical protein